MPTEPGKSIQTGSRKNDDALAMDCKPAQYGHQDAMEPTGVVSRNQIVFNITYFDSPFELFDRKICE
jgi:hypothetical protein